MILPTKGLTPDRALLSLGADVLRRLNRPKTVSRLWEQISQRDKSLIYTIPYDWFLLTLDLLYLWGAIEFQDGQLRRVRVRTKH